MTHRNIVLAALLTLIWGCGDDGGEVGESCEETADCAGGLLCLCATGPIPGTCSETCSDDSDCAEHGSAARCSLNFCPGTNICLPN